jgi:hypothetical protein
MNDSEKKSPGISPDRQTGQAILICEIFTLIHADNSHFQKRLTSIFCAVNCETRPDRFQLARPLSKNLKSR